MHVSTVIWFVSVEAIVVQFSSATVVTTRFLCGIKTRVAKAAAAVKAAVWVAAKRWRIPLTNHTAVKAILQNPRSIWKVCQVVD